MPPEVIAALVGFFAALLGGAIQTWASGALSKTQFTRDSRRRDYERFVEGVAKMSQADQDCAERRAATAIMIEAKARILLSGSASVITALHRYSRHPVLSSEQSYYDFCELVRVMKRDVGSTPSRHFVNEARSVLFEAN